MEYLSVFFPRTTIIVTNDDVKIINDGIIILEFGYSISELKVSIKIEKLHKSDYYTGNLILISLENFIKETYERSYDICLTDTSCIEKLNFSIKLSTLNILKSGISWYNSHGFFSKNHQKEYEQWNEIRNQCVMFDDETTNFWFEKFDMDINQTPLKVIGHIINDNFIFECDLEALNHYRNIILILTSMINYTSLLYKKITI